MRKVLIIFGLLLCLLSCGSMDVVRLHRGTGDIKIYNTSYEVMFPTILKIINQTKLEIVEVDEINGSIFAEGGVSMSSMGEYVGIWVTKNKTNTRCKVEIELERKLKTNVPVRQWGDRIFKELDKIFYEDF